MQNPWDKVEDVPVQIIEDALDYLQDCRREYIDRFTLFPKYDGRSYRVVLSGDKLHFSVLAPEFEGGLARVSTSDTK